MKHVLRLATSDGFALPGRSMRSGQLSIRHETRGEVHSEAVDLDANGTASGTFELPETARSPGQLDVDCVAWPLRRRATRRRNGPDDDPIPC